MIKNRYLILIFVLLMAFAVTNSVRAEDSSSTTNAKEFFNIDEINKFFREASNAANRQQDQLQNVIKGADLMIANRIATLNTLNTRIQNDNRLSANEKAALSSDIQSTIAGLNSVKGNIDAETDLSKAKVDAKQIATSFRIYEIFEPKVRLLVTLNNLQTTSTNIGALIPQIQNLINTLGGQGKDVSELNSLLTDISSQLSTINTTITIDIESLSGVTASSTNALDVLSKVKNDLNQIIKTNFQKVRTDFQQMRVIFRQ